MSTHIFLNVTSLIGLIEMEMAGRDFRCSVWIRLGQRAHCVILFHYSDSLTAWAAHQSHSWCRRTVGDQWGRSGEALITDLIWWLFWMYKTNISLYIWPLFSFNPLNPEFYGDKKASFSSSPLIGLQIWRHHNKVILKNIYSGTSPYLICSRSHLWKIRM